MEVEQIKEAITEAMTAIEPVELQDQKYIRQDDLIGKLFEVGAIGNDDYPELMGILNSQRSQWGLGQEYEFNPPVVPFDRRGLYYQVIVFTPPDIIHRVLNEAIESGRLRVGEMAYEPFDYISKYDAIYVVVAELESQSPRQLIQVVRDHYENAINEYLAGQGWIDQPEQRQFKRPKQVNADTEFEYLSNYMTGETIIFLHNYYRYLAKDAYGKLYNLSPEDYPPEFIELGNKALDKFGYVINGDRVSPKPVELPDNIVDIGHQILGNPKYYWSTKFGYAIIPIPSLLDILRDDFNLKLTKANVSFSLLGDQGAWLEPLVMNDFAIYEKEVPQREFTREVPWDGYRISCLKKVISSQKKEVERADFASGFPVQLHGFTIDNEMGALVYLSMVGSPNAVQANWAAMMQDRVHYFAGQNFKVGTARNHRRFISKLPSGLKQIVLLSNDAICKEIDTGSEFCYLLDFDKAQGSVPNDFIGMLDLLIEEPVLPSWGSYLWTKGRLFGLVEHAGNPNKQIGPTVWKIKKNGRGTDWKNLISAAITDKELSICG